MTTNRKPFAYVNKYTGKMVYLNQQPDAATDTEVYFPLWLHAQPATQDKDDIPDAGKMIIPPGWKLVPVEPTEDMVICGFESEPDETFSAPKDWEEYEAMSGCEQAAHRAHLCWKAMIEAAPEAPNG